MLLILVTNDLGLSKIFGRVDFLKKFFSSEKVGPGQVPSFPIDKDGTAPAYTTLPYG